MFFFPRSNSLPALTLFSGPVSFSGVNHLSFFFFFQYDRALSAMKAKIVFSLYFSVPLFFSTRLRFEEEHFKKRDTSSHGLLSFLRPLPKGR